MSDKKNSETHSKKDETIESIVSSDETIELQWEDMEDDVHDEPKKSSQRNQID